MGEKAKVLLRRAETYNPDTISAIISDGLREFGLGDRVGGRVKAGIINPLFRLDLIIDSYPFLFLTWFKRFVSGRF